jgi:hypothetical protein
LFFPAGIAIHNYSFGSLSEGFFQQLHYTEGLLTEDYICLGGRVT